MNDERLKDDKSFGKDYFDELLERVRSIRASERRIYQKITDIFAECSIDYDPNSEITRDFYATVQNKFHYAITGQTAAEIIYDKADAKKRHMGLTTWKYAPKGVILKSDTIIAKNYLIEKEIKQLERTISSFFDYIERIIENRTIMKMKDLSESVNKFLPFIEPEDLSPDIAGIRPKLQGPGEHFRDFIIKSEAEYGLCGLVNLIGIESPGLTASLAIAKIVRDIVKKI